MNTKKDTSKRSSLKKKSICLVAEGTGETITRIAKVSLSKFKPEKINLKTFFLVRTKQQIRRIVKIAATDNALVAFSIVRPSLRTFLLKEAEHRGIKAIDVIGDFIGHLSIFLEEKPILVPGRQYVLDEDYYRRIEAINYAVKHDDGKIPQGLKRADLILVGLSRTGKTPLSTYLANMGWKVANVPLHPDMDPPRELFQVDPHKIFGLIINVENLVKLREERLKHMGLEPPAKYADPVMISDEIEWCKAYFDKNPTWRIMNVSNKAIEEIAASILNACRT